MAVAATAPSRCRRPPAGRATRRRCRPASRPAGSRPGSRRPGGPDLAVIVTTAGPAAAAAVFTPNAFAAAPVRLSRAHLAATSGRPARRVRLGRGGRLDQRLAPTRRPARRRRGPARDRRAVLPRHRRGHGERTLHLSTGVIGTRLPLDKVAAGLDRARADAGGDGRRRSRPWPIALRTTDSVTKIATTTVELPGGGRHARSRSPSAGSPRASG